MSSPLLEGNYIATDLQFVPTLSLEDLLFSFGRSGLLQRARIKIIAVKVSAFYLVKLFNGNFA